MGRGRQKAKQTKVARKLKYFSPDTDLDALQRELAAGHETHSEEQPDEDDLYARYADYDEDDQDSQDDHWDDEDYWTSSSSQSRK